MLPVAAHAVRPGVYRGLRPYPATVVIAGRPYGWPPGTPWAQRVYDLRGLDPLPLGVSAYRPSYESQAVEPSVGAYRAPVEPLPTAPAPEPVPPPSNSAPATNAEGVEVVPAPPPAPALSAPRSPTARQF
jgi:hypothetical protein